MIDGIYYAYATALFLLCFGYAVGYIVGRLDLIYRALSLVLPAGTSSAPTKKDFFSRAEKPQATKIEIDERKYVGAVQTADLVKSGETDLGRTTVTRDDIQTSVSKLAQLKGK